MKVARHAPIVQTCDYCKRRPAFADAPARNGQWGYMCSRCWTNVASLGAEKLGTIIDDSLPRPAGITAVHTSRVVV